MQIRIHPQRNEAIISHNGVMTYLMTHNSEALMLVIGLNADA
jgi:hypothetical protein